MSEHPVRPTRPSAEDPAALAKKFTGQPARLAVRVDKTTLHEVHKTAVNDGKTVKRFVLDALQKQGVKIAALDLADDDDDQPSVRILKDESVCAPAESLASVES